MQKILKKLSTVLIIGLIFNFVVGYFNSPQVYAAREDYSCRNFLGLKSWDCGLTSSPSNQDELTQTIIIIAANVFTDLTVVASYLVLGYTIYGGYLYILSSGDPSKAMNGKKTLTHAFIGLAIVMAANVVLNSIRIAFLGTTGRLACDAFTGDNCANASDLVTNTINWVIGISGAVALVFVLIGGIGYMTSAGDAGKLQKAKHTIMYALIGLAIVGLSAVITAFISNLIRNANVMGYASSSNQIAKEISYEKQIS